MVTRFFPDVLRYAPDDERQALQGRLFPQDTQAALEACLRLRYSYFVEGRGWVPPDPATPGLERDPYDDHAMHIGVWDEQGVAAYLRALPFRPEVGFMLDRELSRLLSDEERHVLPRENAVELSRFVVRPSAMRCRADPHSVELLLRQLYRASKEHGFERFYVVVEEGWLTPFARRFGLRFQTVGSPYLFPDGTKTVAATATLGKLEAGIRAHSAAKWQWYQESI